MAGGRRPALPLQSVDEGGRLSRVSRQVGGAGGRRRLRLELSSEVDLLDGLLVELLGAPRLRQLRHPNQHTRLGPAMRLLYPPSQKGVTAVEIAGMKMMGRGIRQLRPFGFGWTAVL